MDIDNALLALSGYSPESIDGHIVWSGGGTRCWVPGEQTLDEMNAITSTLNAYLIRPSLDASMAHAPDPNGYRIR